jgi:hypothetical protein
MRFDGWKLGYIEVWWLGVFIAPTTKMAVGEGFYHMAHRTDRCATGHCRCASHVTKPLGSDRWSSDMWGHRTVRCTFWRLLWLCARSRALLITVHLLQTTVGAVSRYSAWHTGQSGATPDSPMNYSGVSPQIPEGGKFGVELPGAPDTVRWHTGQSCAPD